MEKRIVDLTKENLGAVEPFYKKLVAEKPDDAQAHFEYGFICFRLGKLEEAKDLLAWAAELFGDECGPAVYAALTETLLGLKQYQEVLVSARKGFDKDPNNPSFAYVISSAYAHTGQPQQAGQWLKTANELESKKKRRKKRK